MTTQREIVVLSAVRTAIGTYGGSLAGKAPTDLAANCVRAAVQRAREEARQRRFMHGAGA